jgi:hypothetical protein
MVDRLPYPWVDPLWLIVDHIYGSNLIAIDHH